MSQETIVRIGYILTIFITTPILLLRYARYRTEQRTKSLEDIDLKAPEIKDIPVPEIPLPDIEGPKTDQETPGEEQQAER